ncbi:GNAT family N-acetyltransferase [Pseudomonas syringae]|nr:GNAT family N-acetyltransferase [Pseudomonas syringae]
MTHVDIRKVIELPPQLLILEKEAVAQGFRFVTRLIDDWESGNNRFDAQGECLMGAFLNDDLVGIGGVSRDLRTRSNAGRLRRVYIAGSYRGQGIGRILVDRLESQASRHFRVLRLFTDTSSGSAFYARCGFQRVDEDDATHMKFLKEFASR